MSHYLGKRTKYSLRIPRVLADRVRALAAADGRKLNDWICDRLRERADEDEQPSTPRADRDTDRVP